MKLKVDIIGDYKSTVYGKKGDDVTIISTRGEIIIVENKKGERFSATADQVTEEEVNVETKAQVKQEEQKSVTPIFKTKAARSKKKLQPINQKPLFK